MPRQQPRIVFGAEEVDQPSSNEVAVTLRAPAATPEPIVFGADDVLPSTPAALPEHFMSAPAPPTQNQAAMLSLLGVRPGAVGLADPLSDVAIGAAKGLGNTLTGLGEFVYRYGPGVSTISDLTQQAIFGDVQPAGPLFEAARQTVQPTNAAQRLGYGAEQIGEFLIPGAPAERTAVAVASHLAPYLTRAPQFAQMVARLLPRATVHGTTAAGTAALQGQDPRLAGGLAAALPVVGPVAGRAAASLRARGEAFVRAAIKPTVTALKRISGSGGPRGRGLDAKAHALRAFHYRQPPHDG